MPTTTRLGDLRILQEYRQKQMQLPKLRSATVSDKPLPWYSDEEINDMCQGLTQDAAKVRFLQKKGLTVTRKPCGRPLLMRDHAAKVLSGMPTADTPPDQATRQVLQINRAGMVAQLANRRA